VESSLFQHKPDYLLKVRGMSMRDAGIMDGDLLAVQATARRATARSSWPAWAMTSPSSACAAPAAPSSCCRKPRLSRHRVEPGEPFEIEGLAVGLIRNTMLM
jgi:repressor LexA